MKYLITESKLDRVIFKYLDNQDFIQIEKENSIYFVNSKNGKNGEIRYDKEYGWCVIYRKLIKEISSFFSLGESVSEEIISNWVEDTLQMKVTNTFDYCCRFRL
jgi:hypothetical protein